VKTLVVAVVLVVTARYASAYPQFQLSKDQTCASCHISPAGGGLLNENGLMTAEALSQFGTAPEFMYGKVKTPSWLTLGGDFRGAYGFLQTPQRYIVGFPMQADLYGSATYDAFRAYVTVGYQPSIYFNGKAQFEPPWSREHYLMWQSEPGTNEGVFVRAGRFMPVFGLRIAEHDDYIRRYGGTQLYGETYGVAGEYVTGPYEAHLTAFIKDPLIDTVEHSNGVALYGEYRLDSTTAIGAEGMFTASDDDRKLRTGVTAKRYWPCAHLLVQGEGQFVDLMIPSGNTDGSTTYTYQLVGTLMASWFANDNILVDAGLNYYNEDLRIHGPYRNSFDVNVHWFTWSHFETLLVARKELMNFSEKEASGSYVLLMGHYRL
jgi:hypothetical protein